MTAVSPVEVSTGSTPVPDARRSPLADRWAQFAENSSTRVRLVEEPFLTQVNLRVHPESPAVPRIERELNARLPNRPDEVRGDERNGILWLGPDEWLIIAPDAQVDRTVRAARAGFAGAPGSVVDLSANRTAVRLSGNRARDVLEKVCSLDLHPRAFGTGHCAQTLVGRAQVILWQVGGEPAYRLLVRCSFADYLADLLLDAMAEFART